MLDAGDFVDSFELTDELYEYRYIPVTKENPEGKDYTFWGKGVSQGHSDAIRRIEGVADAKQYTIPVQSALDAVRSGSNPELTTRQKHTRECFVVAKEGADKAKIEKEGVKGEQISNAAKINYSFVRYYTDEQGQVHETDKDSNGNPLSMYASTNLSMVDNYNVGDYYNGKNSYEESHCLL